MPNSTVHFAPPAIDELEISLFGPGYGEAIALHIGKGNWILVDSSLEPNSRTPASLQYLNEIGVDVEQSVKLIVATHWHDDHVRGISTLFEECKSARFVLSNALNASEFRRLVTLYRRRIMDTSSGLDEFGRVFAILEARKEKGNQVNPPILATANKVLYRSNVQLRDNIIQVSVSSLSPSDASTLRAAAAFADLLPTPGQPRKRLSFLSPNQASVVLWIQVGHHQMLLGADLERTSDPKTGWSVILDDSMVISGTASVFKVAHHGALSGHEPRIWSELLDSNPMAILSPFCKGNKRLPTSDDIERINGLTPNAYVTSHPTLHRHKWSNKIVRSFVEDVTREIRNAHAGWGAIRLRQVISDENSSWQVELIGNATSLRN
jgi:hypothetical protein